MTRSLFTAASGIQAQSSWMNVISNNIANGNTIAYKGSDMQFKTVFSDTISSGTLPGTLIGGTNPTQIGNGVQISEVRRNHNQGGSIFTGINTDLSIQGSGFFTLEKLFNNGAPPGFNLTRAGNFSRDADGFLTSSTGNRVLGTATVNGNNAATVSPARIRDEIRIWKEIDPATSAVVQVWIGTPGSTTITAANMSNAANTFLEQDAELQNFSIGADGAISLTFETGDRLSVQSNPAATNLRENVFIAVEGSEFAPSNTAPQALLTIADTVYSPQELQIRLVTLTNPQGLLSVGGNNWELGPNAGTTAFGIGNNGSRGPIQAGALESSNIDLAREFTNLILAQRGVEANSSVVRSSSEILQTVINMSR